MILEIFPIIVVLIVCNSRLWLQIEANKCRALEGANSLEIYKCQEVQTLSEIEEELTASWRGIVVRNGENDFLDFSVQSGEQQQKWRWAQISVLDLSQSGALSLGDDGFSAFIALERLNITNARLGDLKAYYFPSEAKLKYLDASRNDFQKLSAQNFERLPQLKGANFSHNNIERIEPNTFAALSHLEFLHLDDNALTSASIGTCESLKELTLSDNAIKKLSIYDFVGLTQLRHLRLNSNLIQIIANGAFEPLGKLTVLNLAQNNLVRLSAQTFRGLERAPLQFMDLSSNELGMLPTQLFAPLRKLQILNLSSNKLGSLQAELFHGLTALRKVYLQENDIDAIRPNTFANLTAFESLDLSGNSIEVLNAYAFGIVALPRFHKLTMKDNRLMHIHPLAFAPLPNMDYLSLSYNDLTRLDMNTLVPIRHLRKLNLGNNLLEEITDEMLPALNDLVELFLDNNKLTFLPTISDGQFPNLRKLTLEGNPWQCTCLDDLFDWLNRKDVHYLQSQSPFYQGEKPFCVVTDAEECERDLITVKNRGYLELFLTNVERR